MKDLEQPLAASQLLRLDDGPADQIGPRDLFRAMCIARAMGEDRMADRLLQKLEDAFTRAAVDPSSLFAQH
ncbi:hypothetical protein [Roseateles sp. P5_E4]